MLETAELAQRLPKSDFARREPELRAALLDAQQRLAGENFPVLVVAAGTDADAVAPFFQRLSEWMDPRFLSIRAFDTPTDEERERPAAWRYWRALPPRGRIALFQEGWYNRIIDLVAVKERLGGAFERAIALATTTERELADDGALILKLWFHAKPSTLKKRLEEDDAAAWHLTEDERRRMKRLLRHRDDVELLLRESSITAAPWHLVETECARWRDIAAGELLLEQLLERLPKRTRAKAAPKATTLPAIELPERTILDTVDLTRKLSEKKYEEELDRLQPRLHALFEAAFRKGRSTVLAFEGWDAAGKGGAIRRLVPALDLRRYTIVPVAAPTEEERRYHYLWRFWRNIPRDGRVAIFDRSWYGRVLVERVEGFATHAEWLRAYEEINAFEDQLVDHGTIVLKFWLHIGEEEQLRRFREREETTYKHFKISQEDYRNRGKRHAYEIAVHDMIERCNAPKAPWHLVAAEDKRHARIDILRTIAERLDSEVG